MGLHAPARRTVTSPFVTMDVSLPGWVCQPVVPPGGIVLTRTENSAGPPVSSFTPSAMRPLPSTTGPAAVGVGVAVAAVAWTSDEPSPQPASTKAQTVTAAMTERRRRVGEYGATAFVGLVDTSGRPPEQRM